MQNTGRTIIRGRWPDLLGQARRGRPVIIAHRGDSAHAPENTLEAARRGHAAGASAWELDVHLTRDGVPVVLHDESLCRTTDVAARFAGDPRAEAGFLVGDFDLAELRALDAGSWFLDTDPSRLRTAFHFGTHERITADARASYGSGRVGIPTLDEALNLTAELDWMVNVELKSVPTANRELADKVVDAVIGKGLRDRVLLSSFDHRDVARAAMRAPGVATAVLSAIPLYRPERYVREAVGAYAYHPSADAVGASSAAYRRAPSASSLRADDLQALQAAGVPVLVFTVNDARPGGLADHLVEAGVSGLFTDDPAALCRLWPDKSPFT